MASHILQTPEITRPSMLAGKQTIHQDINSALQCDLICTKITALMSAQVDSQGDVFDSCDHYYTAILQTPLGQPILKQHHFKSLHTNPIASINRLPSTLLKCEVPVEFKIRTWTVWQGKMTTYLRIDQELGDGSHANASLMFIFAAEAQLRHVFHAKTIWRKSGGR